MARKSARTSRATSAFLLGLAATLAVAALGPTGLIERAELQAVDWRFRHFATAPRNSDILHVDIDDRSLAELGRWPWPREQLASVVEVLDQCGARIVALDIILPDPQEVRYVPPEGDIYSTSFNEMIDAPPLRVLDDAKLADVIAEHPNIFLPMHINFSTPKTPESAKDLEGILTTRPALPAAQAAAEMGKSLEEVVRHLRRARSRAISTRVRQLLAGDGLVGFQTVRKRILPDSSNGGNTAELEILCRAYLRQRALRALRRFSISPDQIADYPAGQGTVTPPLVTFAQNCHGSGFVTVEPDLDGVVRRIPLLGRGENQVYPQFAFALAAADLAGRHGGSYTITADASAVTLTFPDGSTRVIPIDAMGNMLINWMSRPRRSEDWGRESHPRHISAAGVGYIRQQEKRLQKNSSLSRLLCVDLASQLGQVDLLKLFATADRLNQERLAMELPRQRALLFDPGNAPPRPTELLAREADTEARIGKLCTDMLKDIDEFYLAAEPTDQADKAAYAQLKKARALIASIRAANADIAKDIANAKAELRRYAEGKICMIGSVATGAADFVPTPMAKRTPGVMVHANILNTIVSGAFVRQSHGLIDMAVIVLVGAIVSFLAATRPVMLQAAPATVLLGGVYTAFNAMVVFAVWNVLLVLVAPLAAMVASFLVVSAYRQLTEERAKRHIRQMFAHALSPALVDQLIEDPSLARLGGERRRLSCFFSDLAGFTPLSEKLGEQGTVQLLNRYFDRMTEVIQSRHGGYLNKFFGDGLFVLFGAPVLQDDHCRRAVTAALDCQSELVRLNESMADQLTGLPPLACRIGLTVGDVMVGNCGSSTRMDYTAIGDSVNLASRLESANKFFGTQILATEQLLVEAGRDDFLARPLGKIIVVGKNEPVSVWHVVARADGQPSELVRTLADFKTAIELFARRDFTAAAELFQAVLKGTPDDKPAQIYLDLCREYLAAPPGDNWDATLRLTEK